MSKDTSFYKLQVAKKVQETADAVSLYFDMTDELKSAFGYKAGQYLTLRFILKGSDERRSYSLCTRPGSDLPGVTVKRVKKGKVSNHIHDHVKVGDTIEVMPPDGRFTVDPDPEKSRTYYFFGAGSGITPLMSQIGAILEDEPMSKVHLYYGNRNTESIIFKEALEKAASTYGEQLTVDHILSKATKGGGLAGIFKKKKSDSWDGETGRIAGSRIKQFLDRYPAHSEDRLYYICGPGDMIESVKAELSGIGIDSEAIHTEYFTPASSASSDGAASIAGVTAQASITLRGEDISLEIQEKSILETLQEAGYDPPFSCTSGACASCMAKITEGSASMEMCFALSDAEVEDGYVLTCQAHPTTEKIVLSYDM